MSYFIQESHMFRQMVQPDQARVGHTYASVMGAHEAYERALRRGRRRRFWLRLRRWPVRLLSLPQLVPASAIRTSQAVGVQLVQLDQIQGSENRLRDFDRAFYPQQKHTRDRWVGISLARGSGVSLPAVELILVDDGHNPLYFVRDGHHRLSVARAHGQMEIEANVTIWRLRGPAPWSVGARPRLLGQASQQLAGC